MPDFSRYMWGNNPNDLIQMSPSQARSALSLNPGVQPESSHQVTLQIPSPESAQAAQPSSQPMAQQGASLDQGANPQQTEQMPSAAPAQDMDAYTRAYETVRNRPEWTNPNDPTKHINIQKLRAAYAATTDKVQKAKLQNMITQFTSAVNKELSAGAAADKAAARQNNFELFKGAIGDWWKNEATQQAAREAANLNFDSFLSILADPEFSTGWGYNTVDKIHRILGSLGLESSKLKAEKYDQFNSLVYDNIFKILGAQKGVQTEGDALRAQKVFPDIQKTTKGNVWLSYYYKLANQRLMEKNQWLHDQIANGVDPVWLYHKGESEWMKELKRREVAEGENHVAIADQATALTEKFMAERANRANENYYRRLTGKAQATPPVAQTSTQLSGGTVTPDGNGRFVYTPKK